MDNQHTHHRVHDCLVTNNKFLIVLLFVYIFATLTSKKQMKIKNSKYFYCGTARDKPQKVVLWSFKKIIIFRTTQKNALFKTKRSKFPFVICLRSHSKLKNHLNDVISSKANGSWHECGKRKKLTRTNGSSFWNATTIKQKLFIVFNRLTVSSIFCRSWYISEFIESSYATSGELKHKIEKKWTKKRIKK